MWAFLSQHCFLLFGGVWVMVGLCGYGRQERAEVEEHEGCLPKCCCFRGSCTPCVWGPGSG